jgi:hypothetical protein
MIFRVWHLSGLDESGPRLTGGVAAQWRTKEPQTCCAIGLIHDQEERLWYGPAQEHEDCDRFELISIGICYDSESEKMTALIFLFYVRVCVISVFGSERVKSSVPVKSACL